MKYHAALAACCVFFIVSAKVGGFFAPDYAFILTFCSGCLYAEACGAINRRFDK